MGDNAKTKNRKKIRYVSIGIFVVIVIFATSLHQLGYRLKNNLTIGKIGFLTMTIPFPETSIFVDASKKIVTSKENEEVKIPFSPRDHTIIISHSGYFPWKKDFVIPSGETLTIYPIFVPTNTSGQIITQKDPDYWKIKNKILLNTLPVKNKPLRSEDESTILWIEDNAIKAESGSTTMTVIQPDTVVRNIDFYKDRNDVVVFSTSNSIYVIETSRIGSQNFMPIYKGTTPSFIRFDKNSIYVEDGNILMQVAI